MWTETRFHTGRIHSILIPILTRMGMRLLSYFYVQVRELPEFVASDEGGDSSREPTCPLRCDMPPHYVPNLDQLQGGREGGREGNRKGAKERVSE